MSIFLKTRSCIVWSGSENKIISFLLDLLNPLTVKVLGFNINRDTESNLLKAGFQSYRINYMGSDIFKMFIIENHKKFNE